MLYDFFWVIPRRLKFKCRRFGTDRCSEKSAYKLQTPGITQKKAYNILEHGESLKSKIHYTCFFSSNSGAAKMLANVGVAWSVSALSSI
jgi:hypothetical protein